MTAFTTDDVAAWVNAGLAAGRPDLARCLARQLPDLSSQGAVMIDCLAGDFDAAVAQLDRLPDDALALPAPDQVLQPHHLLGAAVRAARGDDEAYVWLRQAFSRLATTSAYESTGRLLLAVARHRHDWATCAELGVTLMRAGVGGADVANEAVVAMIMGRPIADRDRVDDFWSAVMDHCGWWGPDSAEQLPRAQQVAGMARERFGAAAAQLLLEYARVEDPRGPVAADAERHRGRAWVLRNFWVRYVCQAAFCLLGLIGAPYTLPLLLLPIVWDILAAKLNGFTRSESAALFKLATRPRDPALRQGGGLAWLRVGAIAAGVALGVALDAILLIFVPGLGSMSLDNAQLGVYGMLAFLVVAPIILGYIGAQVARAHMAKRFEEEQARQRRERVEALSACQCPHLTAALGPAAEFIGAHHLQPAGPAPSGVPGEGAVERCPATGIRFLLAREAGQPTILLGGDRSNWATPDFVPSDWNSPG